MDSLAEPQKTSEIRGMIKVDARDAIRKLNSAYGHISSDKRKLATARAINHTMAKVKTEASRGIRSIYALDAQTVGKALTLIKADRLTLTGKVIAKGRPISLYKFRARQLKKGVSVEVKKGRRKFIPGVFLVQTKSGHTGVMFRGKYSGGNMVRRKNRIVRNGNDLPISEMQGVSIPKSMANTIVIKSLATNMQSMFPTRLAHELKRVDSIV